MECFPGLMGGTPAERPAAYAEFSPASNARLVTAPLLGVAGALDTQILPKNVAIMADSLAAAGRQSQSIIFSDEGHPGFDFHREYPHQTA